MSDLKIRLASGKPSFGTMISVFDAPDIVRILHNCGLEWFFYDSEHGHPNIDRLYGIFGYARLVGITGLIRIPEINKTEIFRAMDMGVDGIVCPNVESAEEARELVKLAKYAPLGERGVSMTRPHTGFRKVDAVSYMAQANNDTMIICQMETPKGISNLDTILEVEGIDGILIGPNDLTQSMGIFGQVDNAEYLAMVDKVIALCKKHNKFSGIPGKDINALKRWRDKGVQLLQWGSDVSLLMSKIREGLSE